MNLKAIKEDIIIPAPVIEVYKAWTTREGITTFFAPDANVKLEIMGPYEIIFLPDNPAGFARRRRKRNSFLSGK